MSEPHCCLEWHHDGKYCIDLKKENTQKTKTTWKDFARREDDI